MPRPSNALTIPEKHQRRIALDTLRMSDLGARLAGGPTLIEAVQILRDKFGYNKVSLRNKLARYGHHPLDIERMLTA